MMRFWTIVLVIAIAFASLPAPAQNLVSPKLLPPPAELRAGIHNLNASLAQGSNTPSSQPAKTKHWTKTGKILTIVGGAVAADGIATVAYYEAYNSSCSTNLSNCLSSGWKWAGVAEASAGGALMLIGLTRRSSE
jgi:hypothetical protein